MSELDKYKRRMIRSVARLLLEQKKPEDEVWELLSKEMKCDCKLLWKRMRAIAIKKINRLLPVDDRPESIAQIARLSFTDWLLFDLVLVHEDIDVIDRDRMQEVKGQWKSLMDLFTLVQRFNVEFLSGPPLVEAWSSIAFIYNSTGRQCSPMMLQRRWYQLKELTRTNFYNLWFNYRGNQKLWESAKQHTPSKLQMAIAKRYPHVITHTFTEWEELIKERKVILPEEFGTRLTKENEPKSNAPDLIVIEPEIETIDLGLDSDPEEAELNQDEILVENSETIHQEDPPEENDDKNNYDDLTIDVDLTTVKTEPEMDGLSNVQIMETTHLQNVDKDVDKRLELQSNFLTAKRNLALQVSKFIEETEDLVEDNSANGNETIEDISDDIEMNDNDITDTTEEMIQQKIKAYLNSTEKPNLTEQESVEDLTDEIIPLNLDEEANTTTDIVSDDSEELMIQQKIKAYLNSTEKPNLTEQESIEDLTDEIAPLNLDEEANTTTDIVSDDTEELIKRKAKEFMSRTEKPVQNPEILIEEEIDEMDDIIKQKADDFVSKTETKKAEVAADVEVSTDSFVDDGIEFVDDGIEFVDDGIEYVEDDDGEPGVLKPIPVEAVKEEISEQSDISEASAEDTAKFDLKLLMDPVVFTLKLDNIKVYKNNDFFPVRSKDILDEIIAENIPVKKAKNIPIVATEPENVQKAFMSEPEHVDEIISENKPTEISIVVKTEPENVQEASMNAPEVIQETTINSIDDDITHTDDEYSDSSDDNNDNIITDEQKVKVSSHILQKPRNRNYNPILLCKNPDFNTRLKRLTTGFFCSPRNCQLIKACKPMTIDLDKAFERKLVNGTMYLKTDGKTTQPIQNDDSSSQTTSVIPSAMPIQSLIDNTKMDINALIGLPSTTASTVDLTKRTDEEIAERNKVINLRDITEIRRINQKLLTAEVTPIQVQNNDNTNVNVLEQPGQINKGKANDIRLAEHQNPPPLVSIDPPSLVPIPSGKWSSIHGSKVIKNLAPALANKLPTYFSKPGPASNKTGRPSVKTDKPAQKPKTLPVYSQLTRGPLAWNNPKPLPSPKNDFLLTIDTLNKIIVKLSGYDECVTVSKKSKKKKPWVVTQPLDQDQEKPQKEDDKEKEDANKIEEEVNKPEKKPTKKKYCCWCHEKIEKIRTKGRTYQVHKCPLPQCNCCCRDELIDALKEANTQNRTLMQGHQQNLCNAIESVVQQSNHVDQSSQTVPTPLVRVLPNDENDSAQLTPSTSTSGKTVVEAVLNTDLAQTLVVETGTNVGFNYEPEDYDASPIVSQEIVVNTDQSDELQTKEFDNNALRPVLRINITTDPPAPKAYVPVNKLKKSLNESMPSETQKIPLLQSLDINPLVRIRPKTRRDYSHPILVPNKPFRAEVDTTIVLDGSKSCPTIPKTVVRENNTSIPIAPKHEKVIYLDTKNVAAKPSESPIYLGKNKILLTTVKFPPNFAREPEKVQNPTVTPALPLPQGVVLLLMPNGDLTYNLEPGVKLDDEQMDALPNIIAAVKQQLNANVLPANSTPQNNTDSQNVIIIGDDENATDKSVESTNNNQEKSNDLLAKPCDLTDNPEGDKSCDKTPERNQANDENLEGIHTSDKKQAGQQTCNKHLEGNKTSDENLKGNIISIENPEGNLTRCELTPDTENINNQDDMDISIENAANTDIEDRETISQTADLNSSKESNEIIEINEDTESSSEDVIENTNKEVEKSGETAGTRSLLSDLMEMSGISAEDTKPTQEITMQAVHTIPETTINVDLGEETDATNVKSIDNAIQSLGVPYPSSDVVNLPELTPVTSLAELKYACANDGSFFKLDLDTGLIVPINVCIKKNFRNKNAIPSVKAVIDLTDDADATEPATTTNDNAVRVTMIKAVTANAARNIDWNKCYKKIKPNILSVNKAYQNPERVKPVKLFKAVHRPALNTFTVITRKSHEKNKRKVNSDVRIDMIDSDAPMEEEYLDNSFDSDDEAIALNKTKWVSILANRMDQTSETNKSEDSDDSDDEPLAKKVKRKEAQDENVAANDESCTTNSQETEKTPENLPVTAVEAEPMDISNEMSLEDVGPANVDGGEREPTTTLDFFDDESEGSQDDCILGF